MAENSLRGRKHCGLIVSILALLLLGLTGNVFAQTAKVVVLPFTVNAPGDKEALRKSASKLLVERLKQQGVAVVDQTAAASALKAKAQPSEAEAARAARSAGAVSAIYGTINLVGDALSIDARSVSADGKAENAYVTRPGAIELPSAVDELAQKLAPVSGPTGLKVVELDVEGNNALEKDVILLKVKTQVGEPFDNKTVNEDLKRLFELGYFDDVQIKLDDVRGGKRVVFVVKEKPRIQAVSVSGNSEIKRDEILEAMGTKTGSVLNMQVLADDLEKIRDLYRKKGFYQTNVEYKLEQTDPRMARLNIVVQESKKLYIKKINIVGAKKVDPSDLKDQMALKEKNFLSWILQTGVLKEELLDRDSAAIENYYTNHGYIDARVGQPQVDIKDDGIELTIQVEEGERYKLGNVGFKGDLLFDDKKLREITKLPELAKKKDYFDRSVVRDDITRLNEAYSDMGYAFAEADIDMQKNAEQKIVDVTYILGKGQKVYIRRVTIEGNDRTRENVIRRELRLSDGDLFSGTKLKRSNERLNKLDYFEKVDIETVPTENPAEVDIKVKVKDKNTGSVSAGIGYSTYDSVFVGGSVEERNLFGKGYNLQFQGMFSGVTNRFSASFTNPSVYDTPLSFGTDAFSTFRRYSDYYKQSQGVVARFAYPVGEFTTLRWDYRLTRDDVYHTNYYASSVIQESKGIHWTSGVVTGAVRDTTDSRTKPTKGTINDISFEYAGLGGDRGFVKAYYSFNYYRPLFWETVFHFRTQVGGLFQNGFGDVPVFERFYLGGIGNIRGYETDKISPKDHRTNERIGGDTVYFANLEYIFPISKQYGVYGLGFFDAGNSIWRERDGFYISLVKSVGAGMRWYSPMGLIRVEAGYGLDNIQHNQQNFQIGFTMGNTF
ncbi:Outer membrane protein assembly factor BamA [Fundidesulfovibrio magnetotacticus]|uniref:Outer membrane protein assembly factor BamA n=1 Tax=Fundidesulfovibrio magnetotacticus TaxID=2730080 RepID=A0A6V8LNQ0_9BACT|nr:outer membrane protein assembly factor BamA [Fundidesulfovibrio magnetotacticus]GFK93314.1 Outer membrane protein assembly factor BamA [Fundidesulfovibrio magnetotacticus]